MNRRTLQEIVKGEYGRKVAFTDVEQITEDNIVKVVGSCIGILNRNREVIKYLWDYKKGDQPVLYRTKTMRDDINNPVVENHAWEIVQFKNSQVNGEPIQCIASKKDDKINQAVEKFNDYCRGANKHVKDITSGEWTSAVGTSYKAAQRTRKGSEVPFRIVTPSPMNTFVIYQRSTEEPILAVQQLKDINGNNYLLCFDEIYEYRIQNGSLLTLDTLESGIEVKRRLHAFGGIPIVEFPNNQDRVSDIELVISILDALNEMQSNRMDAICQFVQSWMKFVNCDIDEELFERMKMKGTIVVKSNNGSENKADVDIMTQELNQSQSQIAKQDLWDSALSISAIPNREGNTGGDTAGAVSLRNGWDFSKQRAKLKDPYMQAAEKQLDVVLLNIIKQAKGANECPLGIMDFDVQISHSPTDNMLTKAQALQILLQSGIHPLVAIKTVGLWADAEKVFLQSKEYLDKVYSTVVEDLGPEEAKKQEEKAQDIYKATKEVLSNGNTTSR